MIESVDTKWDKVSLRDVTFADAVGFPIFRSESIAFVQYALEHQEPDFSEKPLQEKSDGGVIAGRASTPYR